MRSSLSGGDCAALQAELQAEFERLNAAHFGGKLKPPEIVVSRRKTYGGYYQPSRHRIVVSWQAFQEHGWPETLNTFRHEVAHICHHNHSPAFWELARRLGATRRYAASPLSPARSTRKYVYACPVCGGRVYRARRLRNASCGSCDKKYNPRFSLQLVEELQHA